MTITLNLNVVGHLADVFGDDQEGQQNQRAEADRLESRSSRSNRIGNSAHSDAPGRSASPGTCSEKQRH